MYKLNNTRTLPLSVPRPRNADKILEIPSSRLERVPCRDSEGMHLRHQERISTAKDNNVPVRKLIHD